MTHNLSENVDYVRESIFFGEVHRVSTKISELRGSSHLMGIVIP